MFLFILILYDILYEGKYIVRHMFYNLQLYALGVYLCSWNSFVNFA